MTNGGLLWYQQFNNLQYVTTASFIITTYAQTLLKSHQTMRCPAAQVQPQELITFVQNQVCTYFLILENELKDLNCILYDILGDIFF